MGYDNLDFILTCVIIAIFVLLALYVILCVRPKQPYESLPGPDYSSYLLGNLPHICDPGTFSEQLLSFSLQYGPAYRLMFPNNILLYVVTHPEDVKYVSVRRNFPKGRVFSKCMNELAPGGLLSIEAHKHPAVRTAISAMLNPRFLPDVQMHLNAEADTLLAQLDDAAKTGTVIDIDDVTSVYLLDVIARITLGRPLGAQLRDDTASSMANAILGSFNEVYQNMVQYPMRHVMPLLQQRPLRAHLTKLHAFIAIAAAERAATKDGTGPRALLDIFVDLPGATPSDVAAHSITFLFAGHDTTAHSFSFLLYEVARNPDVLTRIRAEVDAELGDFTGDEPRLPGPDEVERLPYCAQVLKETLRLYPTAASGSVRRVDRESGHLPHCGFPLPENAHILMPPFVMHRSPEYWDNPLEFRPDRFSPEAVRARRTQERSYFPFSAGSRNCIGNFVARYELLALMALFFGRFNIVLRCKAENMKLFQAGVLRPRTKLNDGSFVGLPMSFTRRKRDV